MGDERGAGAGRDARIGRGRARPDRRGALLLAPRFWRRAPVEDDPVRATHPPRWPGARVRVRAYPFRQRHRDRDADALRLDALGPHLRHQEGALEPDRRLPAEVLVLLALRADGARFHPLQSAPRDPEGRQRSPGRPGDRRHPRRSGRQRDQVGPLADDRACAPGRRHPPRALRRGRQVADRRGRVSRRPGSDPSRHVEADAADRASAEPGRTRSSPRSHAAC